MKTWKSKTKGWVTEEPNDWMIDQKTSDGKEIYIGDEVIVYDGLFGRGNMGKHRIVKSRWGSSWQISGIASRYGVKLMLA